MGWIPYPTALNSNAGAAQAAARQQAMGSAQPQVPHAQIVAQLLRGGGQGMAVQPQAPAGQGADPFAAARAAVAQHTGQAMPQGGDVAGGAAAGQDNQAGGQGGLSGLTASAQSGLDNLKQMIGRKSDRRLKSEVSRIGTLPNGLAVYRYRLEGGPFEVGCMADEVAKIRPDATWFDADDGFARVDYSRIA